MRKETTKEEVKKKTDAVKGKAELEKLILAEAMALGDGSQHDMQQMLAYCRAHKAIK